MIEQQGQVVRVIGDIVSVRMGASAGCPACDAGKGCGAGIFGRLLNRKPVTLDLLNDLDSSPGQTVVVGLPESLLLRLVSRLYLLPLLAGLAGAAIGHYLAYRAGAGAAMADGATLLGGIMAGAGVLVRNKYRENESPGKIAVHLLRHADQSLADSCAGSFSMNK